MVEYEQRGDIFWELRRCIIHVLKIEAMAREKLLKTLQAFRISSIPGPFVPCLFYSTQRTHITPEVSGACSVLSISCIVLPLTIPNLHF